MRNKMTKGLVLSFAFLAVLSGLFFYTGRDRADSLPKHDGLTTIKSLGQAFVEVAKNVQPSVVNITTEKTITMRPWDRFGEDFFKGSPFEEFFKGFGFPPQGEGKVYEHKQRSGGSGVIVDKEGYILTNNHVIEGADKVKVRLNDGKNLLQRLKVKTREQILQFSISRRKTSRLPPWEIRINLRSANGRLPLEVPLDWNIR